MLSRPRALAMLGVLLTALAMVMSALVAGALPASVVVLSFLVMLLQAAMALNRPLVFAGMPLKRLVPSDRFLYVSFRPWVLALALVPVLAIIHVGLGWLGLALVALRFAPYCGRLVALLRSSRGAADETCDFLRQHDVRVAVHVSATGHGSAYQINQWLPVLEALAMPVVIILREYSLFRTLQATSLPVVYARNAVHVERVLASGMRTVLYPANPMKNAQLLRAHWLNHFFINHGESDKVVNQSKFLMAYDRLLVAGSMAERRLREAGLPLREGQVVHVGRPQAEMQLEHRQAPAALRTVLYAPTWEGFVDEADYSSVGAFSARCLDLLLRSGRYKVLVKPHPFTGRRRAGVAQELQRLRQLCQEYGHDYLDPDSSIIDAMNRSDIMVTDISSVLNDYLVTGKPIVLCVPQRLAHTDVHDQFPSSRAAYLLHEDGEATIQELLQAIDANDTLRECRSHVRKDSLGAFPEGALQRFRSVILASVMRDDVSREAA